MKYLPYVLKHLSSDRLRTLTTIGAMAACIFLFCTLHTFQAAVRFNLRSASANRLVVRHALSLVNTLPLAYGTRLAAVPGVLRVAATSRFAGFLAARRQSGAEAGGGPDFSSFFPNLAVDAEPFLAMYPSIELPADQRQAFLRDPRGCLIGSRLAREFGWRLGDTFFLESVVPPYRRREGPFEFVVRGIYESDTLRFPDADTREMYFHHDYLYEGTGRRVGAGTFTIEIGDARQAAEVGAAVDRLFENSEAPTRTETEAAFRAGFVSLAGNLALLLNAIGIAVSFTILLVTAITMSVRERRTEVAVLKTLGFSSRAVLGLVLAEALVIAATGGLGGLALSAWAIGALPSLPFLGEAVRGVPNLRLASSVAALGLGLALLLGLLAGLAPAWNAYRARVVEMLREA